MSGTSLCQASSLTTKQKTFTTTTCTRTIFNKLSTSSTSSISSVMNDAMMTPINLQQTINPFDETNKFRLEQSVLSPNLFQIASTSTPERENNGSLWNIEQRAVLYPADIPTDESSLIAQYMLDNRIAKQVSAAVEAFWSQNKIIIESPLANTNTQLRNRLGTMSSSSSKKNPRHATSSVSSLSSLVRNNSATKQYEKPMTKKDQSCQTMLCLPINLDLNEIPGLRDFIIEDDSVCSNKLNNSIRKKLFDQNSDDLSTSTTTPRNDDSFMSPRLRQLHKNFIQKLPEDKKIVTTTTVANVDCLNDDWEDSFEFENPPDKTHRSSSPKKNKKVMCDVGSDNDSVFISETKHGLDLSPVDKQTPKKINIISSDKMDMSLLSNSLFSKNLQHQHHKRVFHFDSEQNSDGLSSPNLSPISQKKSSDLNESSDSVKSQKSIIFMDYSDKSSEKPRQNKSFLIESDETPIHYKREEIYQNLYHDNETYEALIKKNEIVRDVNRTVLGQNSTTTTINQSSSQDTGYQTNCFGQNGTNNSSNVTTASEMVMFKKPCSLSLGVGKTQVQNEDNQEMTSTPMSPVALQDDKFNFENQSKIIKNVSKSCQKYDKNNKQSSNNKKFSISLNSFDSMLPVECSTPEKLKNSSSKFEYKDSKIHDIHNQTNPVSLVANSLKKEYKKDLHKSKTTNNFKTLSSQNSKTDENYYVYKIYDCSSRNNLDCSEDEEWEKSDTFLKNKILKPNNSLNDDLAKKKFEIDYSFMEQSIMGKNFRSPSEYARIIIDKAKQDLKSTNMYINNSQATNRTNRN